MTHLRSALLYIRNNIIAERVRKIPDQAEAHRFYNYPYAAIEEALANAVFHRSYAVLEYTEVNIRPDKIEILSFPGPVPSVDNEALKRDRIVARTYRNRRIGDFLKDLRLTEGRGTGLPKIRRTMHTNGSPIPIFETDEARNYFLVTLPIHPDFRPAPSVNTQLSLYTKSILFFCMEPKSRREILMHLGLDTGRVNYRRYILPLIEGRYLALTIPDKPTSGAQKYYTSMLGEDLLKSSKIER